MSALEEQSGREALADLEASSRLCLASLGGLCAEAEAPASEAHALLLEAILQEREPRVTVRLRASDARQAALALAAEALRELLASYSDVDYEQAEVEAAERRAWGSGGP